MKLSRNEQLIALRKGGLSYRSLAKVFDISESRCNQIVHGEAKRTRRDQQRAFDDRRDIILAIEVREVSDE